MKLLFVTCIKEQQKIVADILHQAQIAVFSVGEVTGFKEGEVSFVDNWFSAGNDSFDSIFVYSFTPTDKAQQALSKIVAFNKKEKLQYPIRAFIVPVEQSSYDA